MSLRKLMENSSLSATQLGIGLTIVQCIVAIPVVLAVQASPRNKDRGAMMDGVGSSGTTTSSMSVITNATLPETVANVLMYGPAAIIAYWKAGFFQTAAATATAATSTMTSKVPMLLLAHFGKKAMEKILLKGSTSANGAPEEEVPVIAAVQTSAFCSVGTYLVATQALPVPAGIDFAQVVFWLGQLGNSFHASLLDHYKAKLQQGVTGSSARGMLPDKGGLFQLDVAAPHLLFEIVVWLGIACSARSVSGYVQAGLTAVVLGYQAKRLNNEATEAETNSQSRSVVGAEAAKPKKRWNLIPYIY